MKVLFKSSAADFIKAVETCSECAGSIKKRPALNSIRFSKREDNFISCESLDSISYVKFLMPAYHIDETFKSIIIESDCFGAILKAIKGSSADIAFGIDETTNNIVIDAQDSGMFTIIKDHLHDNEYPNVDYCVGSAMKRPNDFNVGISVDNLMRLAKIAKHSKATHVKLCFTTQTNKAPIVFETCDSRGVVMPVRID